MNGKLLATVAWIFIVLLSACDRPADAAKKNQTAVDGDGLWFFVLVKSSNYSQSVTGELTFLNYHFFSELFPKGSNTIEFSGELKRHDAPDAPMPYENRGSNFYIEGGHFQTLQALDEAYPNGEFAFSIHGAGETIEASLKLSGPGGKTDIPAPITISLQQNDAVVRPDQVDPARPLSISWSNYSNGGPDPRGVVDDMIFVVVQDCEGERIVHTGLPFKRPDYLRFDAAGLTVDAGTLNPGEPYAMFVEFPHVVDSAIVGGTPGFTSYATATYLDLHTTGDGATTRCAPEMPAMDTGQTDRP